MFKEPPQEIFADIQQKNWVVGDFEVGDMMFKYCMTKYSNNLCVVCRSIVCSAFFLINVGVLISSWWCSRLLGTNCVPSQNTFWVDDFPFFLGIYIPTSSKGFPSAPRGFSLRQREELKLSLMCCPVTDFTAIRRSLERGSEVGKIRSGEESGNVTAKTMTDYSNH